jgi:Cys-tRNA(Pro)/Cys-tRNA(Cys) deacylase
MAAAILPASRRLDLKAAAAALGARKAALAPVADAERATGYVHGGISPFAQKKRLPTLIDESVLQQKTVFVSGGRRGLQIELAPADLVRLTAARTAAIAV